MLKARRLKFIGHMWRRKEELVYQLLMWKPKQGTRKRGRPAITYVDQLRNNIGLSTEELKKAMEDCEIWKILVDGVRASSKLVKNKNKLISHKDVNSPCLTQLMWT